MFTSTDFLKLSSLGKFLATLASAHSYSLVDAIGMVNARSGRRGFQSPAKILSPANFLSWLPKPDFDFGVRGHEHAHNTYDLVDQNEGNAEIEDNQNLNIVFDAMMLLPKDQRNLLIMINIHGVRYSEAADKLQISIETVRSRLSTARDALQHLLEGAKGTHSTASEILCIKGASVVEHKEFINAIAANEEMNSNHSSRNNPQQ